MPTGNRVLARSCSALDSTWRATAPANPPPRTASRISLPRTEPGAISVSAGATADHKPCGHRGEWGGHGPRHDERDGIQDHSEDDENGVCQVHGPDHGARLAQRGPAREKGVEIRILPAQKLL